MVWGICSLFLRSAGHSEIASTMQSMLPDSPSHGGITHVLLKPKSGRITGTPPMAVAYYLLQQDHGEGHEFMLPASAAWSSPV